MNWHVSSNQGKRNEQQDFWCECESGNWLYLGIFDGHGGVEAAELVTQISPRFVFEKLRCGGELSEVLTTVFMEVDRHIIETGIESGTTATVVLACENKVWVANVGDSRAVLIRDGKMEQLTVDHVVTNRVELAQYRSSKWFKEKSRLISQRKITGFKLTTLTRSLGDVFFEDALSPQPDVTEVRLQPGDVLIVATDGLWHFVKDSELVALVSKGMGEQELADSLVTLALDRGGTDNVTVGVLTL